MLSKAISFELVAVTTYIICYGFVVGVFCKCSAFNIALTVVRLFILLHSLLFPLIIMKSLYENSDQASCGLAMYY